MHDGSATFRDTPNAHAGAQGPAPIDLLSLSVSEFIVENRFVMLNRGHRHDEPVHFGTFERTGDKGDHSSSSSMKNKRRDKDRRGNGNRPIYGLFGF